MNEGMTWIYGIWFAGCDGHGNAGPQNWMAILGKAEKDGVPRWEVRYRFRYFKDDKAHGSADEKHQYCFSAKDDSDDQLQKMVAATHNALKMIETLYKSKGEFLDLQVPEGDPKIFFELGSRPWASMKQESNQ